MHSMKESVCGRVCINVFTDGMCVCVWLMSESVM